MMTRNHKVRVLFGIAGISVSITAVTLVFMHYVRQPSSVPVDSAFVQKLQTAKHYQSQFPAQRQTIDLAKKSSLRHAALNAIGMELREVRGMATGSPESVFGMLSHLGGFGEIIWVDQWTNFPVKLPPTKIPGQVVVPRREAVRAALDAIETSGGCLIKAGGSRYLVAKVSEKKNYEAAIRALGWLNGSSPPWVKENDSHHSDAEPNGPANGSQPIRSETNRKSSAAGSRR
jgi:hypothetical protein